MLVIELFMALFPNSRFTKMIQKLKDADLEEQEQVV